MAVQRGRENLLATKKYTEELYNYYMGMEIDMLHFAAGRGVYISENPYDSAEFIRGGDEGSLIRVEIDPKMKYIDMTDPEVVSALDKHGISPRDVYVLDPKITVKYTETWWVVKKREGVRFVPFTGKEFNIPEIKKIYSRISEPKAKEVFVERILSNPTKNQDEIFLKNAKKVKDIMKSMVPDNDFVSKGDPRLWLIDQIKTNKIEGYAIFNLLQNRKAGSLRSYPEDLAEALARNIKWRSGLDNAKSPDDFIKILSSAPMDKSKLAFRFAFQEKLLKFLYLNPPQSKLEAVMEFIEPSKRAEIIKKSIQHSRNSDPFIKTLLDYSIKKELTSVFRDIVEKHFDIDYFLNLKPFAKQQIVKGFANDIRLAEKILNQSKSADEFIDFFNMLIEGRISISKLVPLLENGMKKFVSHHPSMQQIAKLFSRINPSDQMNPLSLAINNAEDVDLLADLIRFFRTQFPDSYLVSNVFIPRKLGSFLAMGADKEQITRVLGGKGNINTLIRHLLSKSINMEQFSTLVSFALRAPENPFSSEPFSEFHKSSPEFPAMLLREFNNFLHSNQNNQTRLRNFSPEHLKIVIDNFDDKMRFGAVENVLKTSNNSGEFVSILRSFPEYSDELKIFLKQNSDIFRSLDPHDDEIKIAAEFLNEEEQAFLKKIKSDYEKSEKSSSSAQNKNVSKDRSKIIDCLRGNLLGLKK